MASEYIISLTPRQRASLLDEGLQRWLLLNPLPRHLGFVPVEASLLSILQGSFRDVFLYLTTGWGTPQ